MVDLANIVLKMYLHASKYELYLVLVRDRKVLLSLFEICDSIKECERKYCMFEFMTIYQN